jgi:hypothetical protein
VLPWSGFWEENYFAAAWPPLGALLSNNYARGAISGLGVVNVVAGLADLAPILTGRRRTGPGDMSDVPDVRDVP